MTLTILLLAAAYALVAALLLLIVIATRLPLLVKIATTVATCGMILLTYPQFGELRGLPTDSPPPHYFKLHWARIVEPNLLMSEPGNIFLWLEELDDQNYPSGIPRAYALPYDPDLVGRVELAMGQIQQGEEVSGSISDEATEEIEGTAEALAQEVQEGARVAGSNTGGVGDRFFDFDPNMLTFGEAAAPVTPEKD